MMRQQKCKETYCFLQSKDRVIPVTLWSLYVKGNLQSPKRLKLCWKVFLIMSVKSKLNSLRWHWNSSQTVTLKSIMTIVNGQCLGMNICSLYVWSMQSGRQCCRLILQSEPRFSWTLSRRCRKQCWAVGWPWWRWSCGSAPSVCLPRHRCRWSGPHPGCLVS